MFLQFKDLKALWVISKYDFVSRLILNIQTFSREWSNHCRAIVLALLSAYKSGYKIDIPDGLACCIRCCHIAECGPWTWRRLGIQSTFRDFQDAKVLLYATIWSLLSEYFPQVKTNFLCVELRRKHISINGKVYVTLFKNRLPPFLFNGNMIMATLVLQFIVYIWKL